MKRVVVTVLVGAMAVSMLWISAEAQAPKAAKAAGKSHMANTSKNHAWIYRHAKGDPNSRSCSLATVVTLSDPANNGTVDGHLSFWTGFNEMTGKYTERHNYTLSAISVPNSGKGDRTHEHITWKAAPSTTGDPAMDVHVSLLKGKNPGQGSADRRLVVRFKFPGCRIGEKKGEIDDCCDQDPDDDVLQEETPPPTGNDPPDP